MRRMFSEKQIENIIKNAIENGSLVLYKDLDISESLTPATISGIDTELKYCRIRVSDDQVLSIVLNFSVENTTEAQISLGNSFGIAWLVPEELGKKIYDVNGKTINEALNTYAGITSGQSFNDNGIPTAGYYITRTCTMTNELASNVAKFNFRDLGNISASSKWEFTFRIFLTL